MKHCEIVRDLLPLYIEDMTSQGSEDFIRDHLSCCSSCMEEYKRMAAPVLPQPEPNEKWKAALEAQRQTEKKQKRRSILLWSVLLLALLALGVPQLKHYINTHKTTTQKITSMEAEEILTLCPAVVPTAEELDFMSWGATLPFLTNTDRSILPEEFMPYRLGLIPEDARIGELWGRKQIWTIDYFYDNKRIMLVYYDEDMDGIYDQLEKFVSPHHFENNHSMPFYSATYNRKIATTQYTMYN